MIIQHKHTLRNIPTLKHIWVNEDLNREIKRQKGEMRALANLAQDQGMDLSAKGCGVIIDGVYITHQTLNNLPIGVSLAATKTRKVKGRAYNWVL